MLAQHDREVRGALDAPIRMHLEALVSEEHAQCHASLLGGLQEGRAQFGNRLLRGLAQILTGVLGLAKKFTDATGNVLEAAPGGSPGRTA